MLTFFLNGKRIVEGTLDANLTLLQYLRVQKNLVGTKEGCASGDCGACTVLVGEFSSTDNTWHYKSVNACIYFMIQLSGKSIITIDAIANGSDLHPAQQAMVELHGSQCGFCTPGFVMSMAGFYENQQNKHGDTQNISRHDIEIALSGNLCRCTGYRPIIDAAHEMFDRQRFPHEPVVQLWQPEEQAIEKQDDITLQAGNSLSWAPKTEDELKELLAQHPDATLLSGATDLALTVTQQHQSIQKLVSLNEIATLKAVNINDTEISIGAAATYSQIEHTLNEHFPEFGKMLERLGSRQIRNSGTLGGNIANASPIGDTPPVLLALGADITLASAHEERRIPLHRFFINYKVTDQREGEYVKLIHIPRLASDEQLKVYKISKRLEDDISAVLFAAKITVDDDNSIAEINTGFGGMAAIPKAAHKLEQSLLGKACTEENFIKASECLEEDFQPIDDVRATAQYRIQVAKGLLRKCAVELSSPNMFTRIEDMRAEANDA